MLYTNEDKTYIGYPIIFVAEIVQFRKQFRLKEHTPFLKY
jgi:hypothetical protein